MKIYEEITGINEEDLDFNVMTTMLAKDKNMSDKEAMKLWKELKKIIPQNKVRTHVGTIIQDSKYKKVVADAKKFFDMKLGTKGGK